MNLRGERIYWLGALLVFLATQAAYILTMTLSCPFWDSGEFIATSYILGIPHPPGTPLYVLIGRLFTMLPIYPIVSSTDVPSGTEIATRVNYLSALASSLACVFTYLVAVELWRRGYRRKEAGPAGSAVAGGLGSGLRGAALYSGESRGLRMEAVVVGLVAAFFCAFGRTFWDNAIEAEVYSLSSLIMALAVWLILRWARWEGGRVGRNGLFILLYYILCLSMGIHLGTFLVLPGIVLFALLTDWRSLGGSVWGAIFAAGLILLLHPGMLPTLGLEIWVPLAGGVVLAGVVLGRRWPAVSGRGLLTWCLVAAVVGMSTHFYLMIRAHQGPAINEADPETWGSLWRVLTRDQYKPPNPFTFRKAPLEVQLTKHFWDYARDQYSLGLRPAWLGWYLPYVLGLLGAVGHWLRERKGFALMGVTYLIMSLGLVFYLNFQESEVRPRDYFFVGSFQFFAVWIGMGAGFLVRGTRQMFSGEEEAPGTDAAAAAPAGGPASAAGTATPSAAPAGDPVSAAGEARGVSVPPPAARRNGLLAATAVGAFLVLLPFLTMKHYWFEHDRSDFWIARDFAYNMLMPLKPNAVIFTNGDNDTFPLWYLQEVEKIRRDVRVANLSLLNTDWYLRQIRDEEPKADLGWSDRQIQAAAFFGTLNLGYHQGLIGRSQVEDFLERTGLKPYARTLDEPITTKDLAVLRLVEREYGRKPLYIALTVPDDMGLAPRMVQKGIYFAIEEPGPVPERVDLDAMLENLGHRYLYRGLLKPDGTEDDSIYKDLNASRLVQNYSAACITAAQALQKQRRLAEADAMLSRALALAPRSASVRYSLALLRVEMGQWSEAEELLRDLQKSGAGEPRLFRILGYLYEERGDLEQADAAFREGMDAYPSDFDLVRDLFALRWDQRRDPAGALEALDLWLTRHPDDQAVKRAREVYADSARVLLENSPG